VAVSGEEKELVVCLQCDMVLRYLPYGFTSKEKIEVFVEEIKVVA
jgi:hypothetical protein